MKAHRWILIVLAFPWRRSWYCTGPKGQTFRSSYLKGIHPDGPKAPLSWKEQCNVNAGPCRTSACVRDHSKPLVEAQEYLVAEKRCVTARGTSGVTSIWTTLDIMMP